MEPLMFALSSYRLAMSDTLAILCLLEQPYHSSQPFVPIPNTKQDEWR